MFDIRDKPEASEKHIEHLEKQAYLDERKKAIENFKSRKNIRVERLRGVNDEVMDMHRVVKKPTVEDEMARKKLAFQVVIE